MAEQIEPQLAADPRNGFRLTMPVTAAALREVANALNELADDWPPA
jgi:hypothetical protein